MTRYDLVSPRKGKDDKTRWHKVGAAFSRDKGGFSLVFDSLPLPDSEGKVTLMMWEAKSRDDNRGGYPDDTGTTGHTSGFGGGGRPGDDLDEEIPFHMEWRA